MAIIQKRTCMIQSQEFDYTTLFANYKKYMVQTTTGHRPRGKCKPQS